MKPINVLLSLFDLNRISKGAGRLDHAPQHCLNRSIYVFESKYFLYIIKGAGRVDRAPKVGVCHMDFFNKFDDNIYDSW